MSTATLATPTLAAPVAPARYQPVVAARAMNASKTYGKGDAVVRALDEVDVTFYVELAKESSLPQLTHTLGTLPGVTRANVFYDEEPA